MNVFPPDLFRDKVALVTGASNETGPAIARMLGEVGTDVALTYLTREEAAQEVAADVETCEVRAKAGVISMTRFRASTFAPRVRVNCLIPGLIDNPEYDMDLRENRQRERRWAESFMRVTWLRCVLRCAAQYSRP